MKLSNCIIVVFTTLFVVMELVRLDDAMIKECQTCYILQEKYFYNCKAFIFPYSVHSPCQSWTKEVFNLVIKNMISRIRYKYI
jgi:hypothetical protein